MDHKLPSNLGLDMVRVTEAAALTAGRWMGLRQPEEADLAAKEAMVKTLNNLNIDGVVVVGEEEKLGIHSKLDSGQRVGTGEGPSLHLVFDRPPDALEEAIELDLQTLYRWAEAHQEEIQIRQVQIAKADAAIGLARKENLPDFKVGLFYAAIGDAGDVIAFNKSKL